VVTLPTSEGVSPPAPALMKQKVCLIGGRGVGKTSLIRRFVTGVFNEKYVSTLGVCVVKKVVHLWGPEGFPVQVDMMIMDVMGQRPFLDTFREAYFSGTKGVLAVFDLTRRMSLRDLGPWLLAVKKNAGPIPVLALANKADRTDFIEIQEEDIEAVLGPLDIRVLRTSAKTGENVEQAFVGLARKVVEESRDVAVPPHAPRESGGEHDSTKPTRSPVLDSGQRNEPDRGS